MQACLRRHAEALPVCMRPALDCLALTLPLPRAQRLGPVPVLNLATVGTIFGKFLTLFAVSLVLGAAAGLISAISLKRFNVSSTPQARPARWLRLWGRPRCLDATAGLLCVNPLS